MLRNLLFPSAKLRRPIATHRTSSELAESGRIGRQVIFHRTESAKLLCAGTCRKRLASRYFQSTLLVSLLFLSSSIFAQQGPRILINEFLASNVTVNADIADFSDFSDWIELYNAGDADVDLAGFCLTDNPKNRDKWRFPPGTFLPAKEFLLVWADGYNEIPGKVHQRAFYPFDYYTTKYFHLSFKLDVTGGFIGLYDSAQVLIDSVSYDRQDPDVSIGRQPDGSPYWLSFGEPTPWGPDTTEGTRSAEHAASPVISPSSGYYGGSVIVSVTAQPASVQIRYTLDGSKPTSQSLLYGGPITLDHTAVFRARVFEADKIPGPVVTNTYFVNETTPLPVVCIATPPELLWSPSKGIYEQNLKGREIPAHFQFFEPGGQQGFEIDAGISMTGTVSLLYPQKSFTLDVAARYGTDLIDYQVFPQRKLKSFTSLYLRNAGVPDNRGVFFRDALLHKLVLNVMDIDCQAYRPAATFLNGQYWGIYNIRDKINSSYLGLTHDVNPMDIDLLEYESNIVPTVMEGQGDNYQAFYDFVSKTDLSVMENYRAVGKWMDIDEFINYQIAEIYDDNTAWCDLNVRVWRERREGARWRWILHDTDAGFGMPGQTSKGYSNNTLRFATSSNFGDPVTPPLWSTLVFRKLLQNNEFRTKFIQSFASYLNTVFRPDSVLAAIARVQNTIGPEMPRHINRWKNGDYYYGYPIPDYPTWLSNVGVVRTFAANRPSYVRQHILDYFGLGGITIVTASLDVPGSGSIVINGIEHVTAASSGTHFKGTPIGLQAVPSVGYRFVRWEGIDSVNQNPVSVVSSQDSLFVKAVFEPISVSTLPGRFASDTVLSMFHSPYYAQSDVFVDSGVTLRITGGVHILMPEDKSIVVRGRLLVDGTAQDPVVIGPNEQSQHWGALCFVNATDSSVANYVHIVGATKGPDFARDWAAISGYKSRFALNYVSVENVQMPIFAQFGKILLNGCQLSSPISADLINIKRADYALVENCDLTGSDQFDSDGIDYDGVASGAVRNNRIRNIYGFNSDAIDLGEDAKDILVENNIIYNIRDKGVSVGQASTTLVRRNVFANCGYGVAVKDFNSYALVEQNTFYADQIGVGSYEKIYGHGGGRADVVNCIIANSVQSSVYVDGLSKIAVSYSISNTDSLPGLHNSRADPHFLNNCTLAANSPAIDAGNPLLPADPDGSAPDIGAFPFNPAHPNTVVVDEIHYHPKEGENNEFIELVNIGPLSVNLTGYRVGGNIRYQFGNTSIASGECLVVAKNTAAYAGHSYQVLQWDSGSLPDGAGSVLLYNASGDLADEVYYDNRSFWPTRPDGEGPSLELRQPSLENMASNSWRPSIVTGGTPGRSNTTDGLPGIYINELLAENDSLNADENGEFDDWIELYNSNEQPVDIGGFYLTDDLRTPNKHRLPTTSPELTTIPAHGFLLLWADGQTEQGAQHLGFKLSRQGEQIGLSQILNQGPVFIDSLTFPQQTRNHAYGRFPDGGQRFYVLDQPTPGSANHFDGDTTTVPKSYALSQNYPNPFNPGTVICYEVPVSGFVHMSVFDLIGREVEVLVNEVKPAGSYVVQWNPRGKASGVYFCQLRAGGKTMTKKMILLH